MSAITRVWRSRQQDEQELCGSKAERAPPFRLNQPLLQRKFEFPLFADARAGSLCAAIEQCSLDQRSGQ